MATASLHSIGMCLAMNLCHLTIVVRLPPKLTEEETESQGGNLSPTSVILNHRMREICL